MSSCVICQLVGREIPAWVIYEDEYTISFLPLEVEVYGHTVIAPKIHCADLFDAPIETLGQLMTTAQRLAVHYRNRIGATGMNLLHASGVSAQQSIPHLHVHLFPRFDEDGLDAWPKLPETHCDKDELLQKLKVNIVPNIVDLP